MNSNNIKNNVKCIHCERNKMKVIYQNKLKSPINKEGLLKETIIDMSQLYCSYCEKITNVLSSDNNIISISEIAMIPLSGYNVEMFVSESGLCGKFSLKEDNEIIEGDDLSEYNMLKIVEYLEYNNICFENIDDNIFQFFFNKEKHQFLSNSSILNYINTILSNAGCCVSFGKTEEFLFDIYVNNEHFNDIIKQSEQLSEKERENIDPEYLDCHPKIIYLDNNKLSYLPILNLK